MANVDKPHGFRPIRALYGTHGQTNEYSLAAANSEIWPGDVVERTADGVVNLASAASVQIVGVAAEYKAANAGGTIQLYDNPGQIYEAQTDNGTGTATVQTGLNLNADFVATAGSGRSLMEIDENSAAATATLPLRLIRLYPDPENALGEFNRLEVMFNNHVYSGEQLGL
jgi:hypothetical protein